MTRTYYNPDTSKIISGSQLDDWITSRALEVKAERTVAEQATLDAEPPRMQGTVVTVDSDKHPSTAEKNLCTVANCSEVAQYAWRSPGEVTWYCALHRSQQRWPLKCGHRFNCQEDHAECQVDGCPSNPGCYLREYPGVGTVALCKYHVEEYDCPTLRPAPVRKDA